MLDVDQVRRTKAGARNHQHRSRRSTAIVIRDGVDAPAGRVDPAGPGSRRGGGAGQLFRAEQREKSGRAAKGRGTEQLYSTLYACPHCKISFEEIEPRTFSFNSPYGACPACEGLGSRLQFDPELVVPDDSLSLADGGVAAWKGATAVETQHHKWQVRDFLKSAGLDWKKPLSQLKPRAREQLFHGDANGFIGMWPCSNKNT